MILHRQTCQLPTRLTLVCLLLLGSLTNALAAQIMTAQEASKLSQTGEILLIDIRRPEEWKQTGVAQSAVLNSMHEPGFIARLDILTKGDKSQPVALICARGNRSTWLTGELEKRGYENIINVTEGMLGSNDQNGWLRAQLPIRKIE